MISAERAALEARWLDLTRRVLPGHAAERGWPIRNDHCFMRVFLDNACGRRWTDIIAGRPAYAHAPDAVLAAAVALAELCATGQGDLCDLNRKSLDWRQMR